MTPHCTGQ